MSSYMYYQVVCLSSVMQVYCDKTTEVRITLLSHKSSIVLTFSVVSLTEKFERVP